MIYMSQFNSWDKTPCTNQTRGQVMEPATRGVHHSWRREKSSRLGSTTFPPVLDPSLKWQDVHRGHLGLVPFNQDFLKVFHFAHDFIKTALFTSNISHRAKMLNLFKSDCNTTLLRGNALKQVTWHSATSSCWYPRWRTSQLSKAIWSGC